MGRPVNPKDQREHIRQKELKNNVSAPLRDGLDRGMGGGNLSDLSNGMSWKQMLSVIVVLGVGYIVYTLFF